MKCWQDLDRTIPAVNNGDAVAVLEPTEFGEMLIQPDTTKRPTLRGDLYNSDRPIIVNN